ncbi:MAG: TlpA family protein disulfide reductase [Anaerolineae bacterium]|nr:TlpA family protein disulfide reductase [Anaerolineae bacterium]
MKRKNLTTIFLLGLMVFGSLVIALNLLRGDAVTSIQSRESLRPKYDQTIPAVTLITLDNGPINLGQDRGTVTILFGMSYWCGTCVPEAQALARLMDEYGKHGLQVVVIDLDPEGSAENLQPFIEAVGDNHLIWAFDNAGQFAFRYSVRALDTTIIVNAEGYEVYRDIQPTSYETLRDLVEQLL